MATNREVALAWANGEEKKAAHFRSVFWDDSGKHGHVDLYSYAKLIGRRWQVMGPDGNVYRIFWVNSEKRSMTTSRHQGEARNASWRVNMGLLIPHLTFQINDGVGSKPTLLGTLREIAVRGETGAGVAGVLADWLEAKAEQQRIVG